CPKKFYIERDLFYHKVVHEVKRICDQCGKSYSTAKALARHIETHSDVKHICELCGLALKTSHSLQNHMYSHAEYYRYTCHYCGKGFRRSNSMKLHLMIHQALKPYKCRFCEKTFTDSAVSRSHMKSAHSELHRKAVERNNGRPIGAIILYKIPSLRQLEEIAKKEGKPIQDVGPYRGEEKWQEKMFGCKSFE
uniref:C2H2-type domain-containing protein n=1 Tax=Megaselia scalaris TaxID=36166 RepID=T1GYS2_MEGSC